MRIPRIYLPVSLTTDEQIELDENAVRHVVNVLRLKPGAQLVLFNGDGYEFIALLVNIQKHRATVQLVDRLAPRSESSLQIHLGIAIAKGERMEFAIQKSVELGVTHITPILTERSVVQLDGKREQKRLHHWQGVINNACEQSGRVCIPTLKPVTSLNSWLEQADSQQKCILDPRAQLPFSELPRVAVSMHLGIGPEGGFSEQEIEAAHDRHFRSVSLGPRVLRAETAVLAAMTSAQLLWGDL